MKKTILLTIQYDGSMFHGWQRQPEAKTVQGELENALTEICNQEIKIDGTSRTDAGVHALGQRATFTGDLSIPVENIKRATNDLLSRGSTYKGKSGAIRIIDAVEVEKGFHARFNSTGKRYRYVIDTSENVNPFDRNYVYSFPIKDKRFEIDVNAMKKAAVEIIGTHDFKCFQAAGGAPVRSTIKTIHALYISYKDSRLTMEVSGDGFLYNMVRIIAGTLLEVGIGKKKPDDMKAIIASGDRAKAGPTAPAEGLYLVEVFYDKEMN